MKNCIKKRMLDAESIYPLVLGMTFKKMTKYFGNICRLATCLLGVYSYPREFIILDEFRLAYLNVPKVACSSIKHALFIKSCGDIPGPFQKNIHSYGWQRKSRLTGIEKNYSSFTFVRNPFERLASTYINKFKEWHEKGQKRFEYEDYLCGIFFQNMAFDEFIQIVCRIPDRLAENHFRSQYSICYDNGRQLVDYIGNFESLERDYASIRKKFGLPKLPHVNRSAPYDYRTLYCSETALMVAKRYKNDIEKFGYHELCSDLVEYCYKRKSK